MPGLLRRIATSLVVQAEGFRWLTVVRQACRDLFQEPVGIGGRRCAGGLASRQTEQRAAGTESPLPPARLGSPDDEASAVTNTCQQSAKQGSSVRGEVGRRLEHPQGSSLRTGSSVVREGKPVSRPADAP